MAETARKSRHPQLKIVGTGIRAGIETSPEALSAIQDSKKVLYLVADPVAAEWIGWLNPSAETLSGLYAPGKSRRSTYQDIVAEILTWLRVSGDVCVVFYGHPCMLVFPTGEVLRSARAEGYTAKVYAAISSLDRLFADLEIDPGLVGCQSFEATTFLLHGYRFDTRAALVLFQVGVLGEESWNPVLPRSRIVVLSDYLSKHYGGGHPAILYEAASLPIGESVVLRTSISRMAKMDVSAISTLYIPPIGTPEVDSEMKARLEANSS